MSSLIFVIGVVLFFIGLLASIALHEVGHMLPAKKFGMKVSQYFIGFGRTVWSTKRGETEYGIKAIPFGGFVRIVGMFPPAVGAAPNEVRKANTGPFQTLIDNARHAEYETVDPADTPRLFYQKPWWQKLIVMAGGPLVNVVIAFVLFAGVFTIYGVDTPTTTVSSVTDCVIPASDAGRTCAPADKPSPAKQAGLHVGDKVIAFNGNKINAWSDLTPLIRNNGDKPATIVVERNGVQLTLTTRTIINQVYDTQNTQDPQKIISVGFLGVSPEQVAVRQNAGFVIDKMGELTVATVKALGSFPGKLVGVAQSIAGGQRAQDSPMSVVGASRAAGELASYSDWTVGKRIAVLLSLLASVNLFLALFNFIPLLPLDGGHIAGALWEAIKRGFAKLFRRPDPGYVDVAKLLPLAYVAASFIVVMGVLLVVADIVNPIKIFNG